MISASEVFHRIAWNIEAVRNIPGHQEEHLALVLSPELYVYLHFSSPHVIPADPEKARFCGLPVKLLAAHGYEWHITIRHERIP